MGYLNQMYGYKSPEFIAGVKAGIKMYAVWKNGKEFVGCLRTPLEDALKNVDKELRRPKREG